MTDHPWETEPSHLDFEAEGLPCAMRRCIYGSWCGYVGVGPEHPLYGLPYNHPLKLPSSWFEGRTFDQGVGPFDIFMHALSGAKSIDDACPISIAFHVHGGCNWTDDHVPHQDPDGRWWFGFDCGHAGDYMPGKSESVGRIMDEMVDSMPEAARETMRRIMRETAARTGDYRDQQYVVGECQSLAAQLNAIVGVIERENANASPDGRRD
jgi:hypothetical protein